MPFKSVVFDYPLGKAMADGFVQEPAVVTRKDFNPTEISPDEIERMKLEDGVRLHESVKVDSSKSGADEQEMIARLLARIGHRVA